MGEKVKLCALAEIADCTARQFVVGSNKIALVRSGDDYYAVGDTCSHANYSLSEGEVYCEERSIECWKHGSTFSLVTGMAMNLPATRPVPVYELEIDDEYVWVVLP